MNPQDTKKERLYQKLSECYTQAVSSASATSIESLDGFVENHVEMRRALEVEKQACEKSIREATVLLTEPSIKRVRPEQCDFCQEDIQRKLQATRDKAEKAEKSEKLEQAQGEYDRKREFAKKLEATEQEKLMRRARQELRERLERQEREWFDNPKGRPN